MVVPFKQIKSKFKISNITQNNRLTGARHSVIRNSKPMDKDNIFSVFSMNALIIIIIMYRANYIIILHTQRMIRIIVLRMKKINILVVMSIITRFALFKLLGKNNRAKCSHS